MLSTYCTYHYRDTPVFLSGIIMKYRDIIIIVLVLFYSMNAEQKV